MPTKFMMTAYVDQAIAQADYDALEDGTCNDRNPAGEGVVAVGITWRQCQDELCSTLEDWIVVGPKCGHFLPVMAAIDLDKEPTHESVNSL